MEQYNKQITEKGARTGMYVSLSIIVLAGLIGAFMTQYMRSPWMFWIVFLVATGGYVALTFRYWRNVQAEDQSKGLAKLILPTLAYLLVTVLVAVQNRSARVDNCLPAHELVSADGYIYDTEKAIDFYEGCGKYVIDEPTKSYMREHRKLPSWILSKDGYTSDAVGWWQYHSTHAASPYNLTPEVKAKLFSGPPHKLPKEAYK